MASKIFSFVFFLDFLACFLSISLHLYFYVVAEVVRGSALPLCFVSFLSVLFCLGRKMFGLKCIGSIYSFWVIWWHKSVLCARLCVWGACNFEFKMIDSSKNCIMTIFFFGSGCPLK